MLKLRLVPPKMYSRAWQGEAEPIENTHVAFVLDLVTCTTDIVVQQQPDLQIP